MQLPTLDLPVNEWTYESIYEDPPAAPASGHVKIHVKGLFIRTLWANFGLRQFLN